jgi:hypothetical protein
VVSFETKEEVYIKSVIIPEEKVNTTTKENHLFREVLKIRNEENNEIKRIKIDK